MPRKSDSVAIKNKSLDRRVKLTDEERIEIADTYKSGGTSYNKLAVEYGVSKRLIMFIVNPDKYEVAKNQFSERQKDGRYYDREKHNKAVKKHRDYKKELFSKGEIG